MPCSITSLLTLIPLPHQIFRDMQPSRLKNILGMDDLLRTVGSARSLSLPLSLSLSISLSLYVSLYVSLSLSLSKTPADCRPVFPEVDRGC